ncbi:MAG: YciI family protein [Bacteroidota bacterium]
MNDIPELSPEERKQFASLSRIQKPPSDLEENIIMELRDRNLLHPPIRFFSLSRIAAAVALLLTGGAAGYFLSPSETPQSSQAQQPMFALFLHETIDPRENTKALVAEYSLWARNLHTSGRFVTGEKLGTDGQILMKSNDGIEAQEIDFSTENLSGFFIIQAQDYNEAMTIASGCPHLKYGGKIEVRKIDPT